MQEQMNLPVEDPRVKLQSRQPISRKIEGSSLRYDSHISARACDFRKRPQYPPLISTEDGLRIEKEIQSATSQEKVVACTTVGHSRS